MKWLAGALAALTLGVASHAAAQAQSPVIVVSLMELSGAATIAGTNFHNGVQMAFNEINAAGGILGQRVQLVTFDTQSNPDVARALVQRAVALQPYAIIGPVFSGSTLATMDEAERAQVPMFTAARRPRSRTRATSSCSARRSRRRRRCPGWPGT